jgi:hypothetical protein
MQLEYVTIQNFRSIQDAKIDFRTRCRVLVGINESGKSNILKALSSLGDYMPSLTEDVREPLPEEPPIEESLISFVFRLDPNEIEKACSELRSKILSNDVNKLAIAQLSDRKFSLKAFVELRSDALYEVDVLAQEKGVKYWTFDKKHALSVGWMKPAAACPADFRIDLKNIGPVLLKVAKLVYRPDFPDVPEEYFAPADIHDLVKAIASVVTSKIEENLPSVLYWQYNEANLLPGSINIDEFAANPDVCAPLKNMFILAKHADIPEAIRVARSKSRNSFRSFFAGIAKKATAHFRSVWKDYKTVEFDLSPEREVLIPGVKEKNVYNFAERSDGFKRFVSFLLLISAKVKSGVLSNSLLLIDEPDASLHPSGARFLRDELIRISSKNYVVYSTHSIFMIDGEKIGRHVIVTKVDEKTNLSDANDSNIIDEELLFKAVGYSIFEILKKKNLIFEGWKDKQLFKVATKRLAPERAALKEAFKEVGVCHVKGVKQVKSITPMMELARRECLIISDADAVAKEKQKMHANEKGYGVWMRYDEVLGPEPSIVTGEEFVKPAAFRRALQEARERHSALTEFDETTLADPRGKLYSIERWLQAAGLDQETRKSELETIKDRVFVDLNAGEIEDSYFEFLSKLASILAGPTEPAVV